MKLSHRDRVLLTIVLVAIVWLVGIWFFVIPAFQELGDKRDELNTQQVALSKLNDQIEQDKDLPQKIEAAYNTSEELAKNFYTMQTTQNATNTVDLLLDECVITNTNMQISEYSVKTLKPFYYVDDTVSTDLDTQVEQYEQIGASSSKSDKKNSSSSKSSKDKFDTIPDSITPDNGPVFKVDPNAGIVMGSYDIEFAFKGKYGDLQTFCEKLSKNVPGSMVVSTMNISNVFAAEEEAQRQAEKDAKNGKTTTETEQTTEKPAEQKKEGEEEENEFNYDDKEVEGTVGINLLLIKKLTKPSF